MASNAGYNRCSPPVFDPVQEACDPLVDDCLMPKSQLSNPRKRQHSDQRPLQLRQAPQPLLKTQKKRPRPSYKSQTPPAFWDNLSKLYLTKRALRELDRRNAQSASTPPPPPPCPSHRQTRGTLPRHGLTKVKWSFQSTPSASEFLYNCAPRCLKDIKLFARHGGPNLTDLRGFAEPVNSPVHTMPSWVQKRGSQAVARTRVTKIITETITENETTTISAKTKSTGPYDLAFQQNLADGGIFPFGYRRGNVRVLARPSNWEEINQRLVRPRRSLSPSNFLQEAHEEFIDKETHAANEKEVEMAVIPIIEGNITDQYVRKGTAFKNLDHLTNGTLKPGNSDHYHGACPDELDQKVRDELSGHISPTAEASLVIAPNFFLELKGPSGNAVVADRSACYNGALGARGMHSLQSYGQDRPIYDSCAYTITSTYLHGTLSMFTSHPVQPKPGKKLEIYMNRICSISIVGFFEHFRQRVIAYRNARDWAKEQRDKMIRRANAKVNDSQAGLRADDERVTAHALSEESRTSLNEDFKKIANLPDYETIKDELKLESRPPVDQLSGHSRQLSRSTRIQKPNYKRVVNPSERDLSRHSEQPRRSQRKRLKPTI